MDFDIIKYAVKSVLDDEKRTRFDGNGLDETSKEYIAAAIVKALEEYDKQKNS